MTRSLPLLAVLALFLPSSALAQDEAEALVRKAIQATGGEANLAQVQGIHTKIKGVLHALEGAPFTGEFSRQGSDRFRYVLHTEVSGVVLTMVTVVNGKEAWSKVNEEPEMMSPRTLESLRRSIYVDRVASLLPLLKDKVFQLSALGESKKDGQAVVGVKVTRKDQPEVRLYFDKETMLLARLEYRAIDDMAPHEEKKEVDVVVLYSEHREIDPAGPEEARLTAAKVGTDGPALLEFVRKRSLAPAARDRLAGLVRRLGAEGFAEREEAARELIAVGAVAVPFLNQAARSTDAEVAQRAKDCLAKIKGDQDTDLTTAVVRLIGYRRPAGAAEVLLAFLPTAADEKLAREVRFALAAVAVRDGKPEKVLEEALQDKDASRRAAAQAALGKDGGALLKEPGRRLFVPNLRLPMRILEYREGKKYIEWQRLEISYYDQLDAAVFAKP